ncbi:putative PIG3 family NAD(P)H quinone oxidoreductase [Salana multivorans]|uniref:Putative PIG3 family NAD(P)H quinone oxidoreductase n=1 Tax=Salana multivorans TaxID=120377 RepID=A0A3N2D9Y5_9MICO|nr:NAD(P)H-quinone oxidoreductase [Salana multivorans]ROR96438.1 putative PIG3 family NAD(P)H quinone oxidoreductase [Salana multivorans]
MRLLTIVPADDADAEPLRLRLIDAPTPRPGPGEALVRVTASGVNRADLLQVAGHYPPPPGAPEHPGLEVAGVIEALGDQADAAIPPGTRVMALLAGGGYADAAVVPVGQLLPIPDTLTDVEAAALPEALATVWSNLVGVGDSPVGNLRAGDTLHVIGGSGGIGTAAVQVGRLLGARVVATAGGPDRCAAVRALGADVVLDHRDATPQDVTAAVLAATDGRGVDVVLDVLGGATLTENVRRLATGGRLVVIGTQRGRRGDLDVLALMQRRASIHGTTLRGRPLAEKAAITADVAAHLLPALADGRLRPVVHAAVPAADAERAHAMLRDGAALGKVVLTW